MQSFYNGLARYHPPPYYQQSFVAQQVNANNSTATTTAPWNPFFSTSSKPTETSFAPSSSQSPSVLPRFVPVHSFPFRQADQATMVSTASPNISTTSSGYCTSEDLSMNEDKDSRAFKATIKKEGNSDDYLLDGQNGLNTQIVCLKASEPSSKHDSPKKAGDKPLDWNHTMQLPTDNIYELATRILFAAVKWARTQRSFLGLPFTDQAILLEECWSELFVLTAAEFRPILNESEFPVSSWLGRPRCSSALFLLKVS
jgi:hypothetical protein